MLFANVIKIDLAYLAYLAFSRRYSLPKLSRDKLIEFKFLLIIIITRSTEI